MLPRLQPQQTQERRKNPLTCKLFFSFGRNEFFSSFFSNHNKSFFSRIKKRANFFLQPNWIFDDCCSNRLRELKLNGRRKNSSKQKSRRPRDGIFEEIRQELLFLKRFFLGPELSLSLRTAITGDWKPNFFGLTEKKPSSWARALLRHRFASGFFSAWLLPTSILIDDCGRFYEHNSTVNPELRRVV